MIVKPSDQQLSLSNLRIVDKSLVYAIGFPEYFLNFNKFTLKSKSFFGLYGKVISITPTVEEIKQPFHHHKINGFYVKYKDEVSAACAVLSLDKSNFNN